MFGDSIVKAAPDYSQGTVPRSRADNGKGTGSRLAAIFVRHGDTAANKGESEKELVRGQLDVPLNSDGREEAVGAGRTIAGHGGVATVFHSPLSRGRDTAKSIAKATGGKRVQTPTLLPWDKGNAEGKPVEQEDPKLRDYAVNRRNTAVPGGESYGTFAARFDAAAKSVVQSGRRSVAAGKGPVAAVSHSVGMRRFGAIFSGKPEPDPLSGGPEPGEMVGVTVGGKLVKVKPGIWGKK